MVAQLILLALAQPVSATAPTIPTCSLVTPRGDALEFFLWTGENPQEVNFTPASGSVWPRHTLVGSSRNMGRDLRWYVVGDREGFILMMAPPTPGSDRRPATLMPRDGREFAVPRAYGYCDERPIPVSAEAPGAQRYETGTDAAAFDPALWPDEDCALLLTDGRRLRVEVELSRRNQARLRSPALWAGRPVTTSIRWSGSDNPRMGTFSGGGLEGTQMLAVSQAQASQGRAARVFHLTHLGDPSLPNISGYGICGYRAIVRRPG